MKRFFWKRNAKRSLFDAFTRDDPSAFGYDKKKRSDEQDEDKRRKKSI